LGLAAASLIVLSMNLIGLTGNLNDMRPLAWGLPAAGLVAAAALGRCARPESRLTRFGALAGDMSYAIYLVHPFAIRAAGELVRRAGIDALLGPWGFMALALPAAFAAGWLTHVLVERPATAFLRARLGPVAVRAPART
jgi:peptidoglycan/LPS O-acetylase OafA/YrhL